MKILVIDYVYLKFYLRSKEGIKFTGIKNAYKEVDTFEK